MANANQPFGARLIDSEGKEVRGRRYPKKSGNVIAEGDFVKQDATGAVELAAAGDSLLGVALETKAALSTDSILICDDPEAVFEIQASGALAAADVFNNAQIVATAYDSALSRSKHTLDVSTLASNSNYQLKVLGLSNIASNAYGSYARVKVKINNHTLKGGTGSLGV